MPRRGYDPMPLSSGSRIKPAACSCPTAWPGGSLRPQQDPFAYVRELVQTPNRPGPLLTQVTSALRQRYRLSFSTPADGLLHRLEVRVARTGAAVHVQKRFLAPR